VLVWMVIDSVADEEGRECVTLERRRRVKRGRGREDDRIRKTYPSWKSCILCRGSISLDLSSFFSCKVLFHQPCSLGVISDEMTESPSQDMVPR